MPATSSILSSFGLDRLLHPSRSSKKEANSPHEAQTQFSEYLSSNLIAQVSSIRQNNELLSTQIIMDFVVYGALLLHGDGEDTLHYMNRQSLSANMPISPLLSITISSFVHVMSTPDLLLLFFKAGGSVLEFLAKLALNLDRHPHEEETLEEKREAKEEHDAKKDHQHEHPNMHKPAQAQAPLWQSALKAIVAKTASAPKAVKAVKAVKTAAAKSTTAKSVKAAKVAVVKKESAKSVKATSVKSVKEKSGKTEKTKVAKLLSKLTTYMGNPDNPKAQPLSTLQLSKDDFAAFTGEHDASHVAVP